VKEKVLASASKKGVAERDRGQDNSEGVPVFMGGFSGE